MMENKYICHYGVKGMKWGVRKEDDQTIKKIDVNKDSNEKLKNYIVRQNLEKSANKLQKESEPPSKSQAAAQVSSDILRGVRDAANAAQQIPTKKGKTITKKYPEMSDDDLKKAVSRLDLERRYSDLKGDTKYVKSGGEKVKEAIQTIGAVTAIGLTVAELVKILLNK